MSDVEHLGGPVELEAVVDGSAVARVPLPHGVDPRACLRSHGWAVLRPLGAWREGPVVISFESRVCLPAPAPRPPRRADAVRVQRVVASVLVTGPRGLLAGQNAAFVARAGQWTLPGGGVDAGEDPAAGAARETWEETGQRARVGDLLLVDSSHWVGHAPSGRLEDFQAIRLVFAGECPDPSEPVVHDVGGTTSAAAWIPPAAWESTAWSEPARHQLVSLGLLPGGG